MTHRTSVTGTPAAAGSAESSVPQQNYGRLSLDEFIEAAKKLVGLGWHPIPLGSKKGKKLLATGVTGHEGIDVSDEETFRDWAEHWATSGDGLNLGTRMPVGVIALDVDSYDGKPGAETMADRVDQWGDLPPTWSITARRDGSAKLLYRVPDDWKGPGILGPGVEVVQRHHRYAVVPPSVHDVGRVKVYNADGLESAELPVPDELPMLPEAWLDGLRTYRAKVERDRTATPDELLASFTGGAMSEPVQKAADKALDAIRIGVGRHDAMRDSLLKLMSLGRCGAPGVPLAVSMVRTEFVAMRRAEGDDGSGDFQRALDGAAQIAAAIPENEVRAFQPGGAWHKDTAWIPDPEEPGLLRRGVPPNRGSAGEKPERARFAPVGPRALAQPVPPMEWMVKGVWPRHSFGPMGGEKKTLKSYNLLSMAVAVASGEPLFGEFAVEAVGPVLYYVGEGGQGPFQRRLQAVARAYDVDLAELPIYAVFDVGSLDGDDFIAALRQNMEVIQPELVIIDPLYAFHPSGVEAQNLYERGRMLAALGAVVGGKAALIIADHFKKTGGSDLDLDSIAQTGMGQWADSWILQKHRETPDLDAGAYRLAVEFGSRQWGGSRWEVDWNLPALGHLEEGEADAGVSWEVRRADGGSARGERRRGGSAGRRAELLDLIRDNPFTFTKNQIFEEVGGNKKAVRDELDRLVADRRVEVKKAAAREAGGREVTRDRYGPGPGFTFQKDSASEVPGDDDA